MTFLNLQWLYVAVPLLLIAAAVRFWRRHYWGHSLVRQMQEEIGGPNPILRMPAILEGTAVALLVIALLGPVYPFVVNQIERGGLQIVIVLDLSQSMEIPLGNRTRMESIKASATEFIERRRGDAVGLVVFSHNGYLVTPATFDHESLLSYLQRVSPETLAFEGYTAIGEGLAAAQEFFLFSRERGGRGKGEVIVLFSDGENNWGRDPLQEVERARQDGVRIYFIGVALEEEAAGQIAAAVPSTGGKFFDAQNPGHIAEALEEINTTEQGRFYSLQLTREQPAYFIFALLAFVALALRMILHGIPHFVELS
jgi:Ca-activated chloride channel family protein